MLGINYSQKGFQSYLNTNRMMCFNDHKFLWPKIALNSFVLTEVYLAKDQSPKRKSNLNSTTWNNAIIDPVSGIGSHTRAFILGYHVSTILWTCQRKYVSCIKI